MQNIKKKMHNNNNIHNIVTKINIKQFTAVCIRNNGTNLKKNNIAIKTYIIQNTRNEYMNNRKYDFSVSIIEVGFRYTVLRSVLVQFSNNNSYQFLV